MTIENSLFYFSLPSPSVFTSKCPQIIFQRMKN